MKIRTLSGLREKITRRRIMDSVIIMEPKDFFVIKNQQQTLTNSELRDYIGRQRLRGAGNVKVFEMELQKRFADPFAAFILSTIGLCLSFRKRKGGMGGALGLGLALSATYILLQTISSTLAINSNWPPILAAWLPNIIFTVIAFLLVRRAQR